MNIIKNDTLKKAVALLELTKNNLEFIDSKQKYYRFIDDIHNKNHDVVGLDCEWKPVYEKGKKGVPSILQFATRNKIFILDLLFMNKYIVSRDISLLNTYFKSSEIKTIKLGFAFQNDAKMIRNLITEMEDDFHKNILNIDEVALSVRFFLYNLIRSYKLAFISFNIRLIIFT